VCPQLVGWLEEPKEKRDMRWDSDGRGRRGLTKVVRQRIGARTLSR